MKNGSRLEIEEKIKNTLITKLGVAPAMLATTSATTPLLGRGIGLDSMETLVLVTALEKHFNIEIADDELTIALFASIDSLTEHILEKIQLNQDRN